jgi:predicted RNase H-like nuclease (RuvC/YqgF family)
VLSSVVPTSLMEGRLKLKTTKETLRLERELRLLKRENKLLKDKVKELEKKNERLYWEKETAVAKADMPRD